MKKIQEKVKIFCKDNKMEFPAEHRVLDMISEVGEVAKEVLKMSDYGKKPIKLNKEIKAEIGDLFYSLITLANYFEVDLEEVLDLVLEKYQKRLRKGSAGSEND